jgi:TRAP-type transport system periplasmic protein
MGRSGLVSAVVAVSLAVGCPGGELASAQAAPARVKLTAPITERQTRQRVAQAAPTAPPAKPGTPTLGPGPKVSVQMMGQSIPTVLQYSKVELPYANEIIPQRSNGRVEVTLSTWAERGLAGTEIVRLISRGQVDVAHITLTVVAGDVPLLDAADLTGLNPTIEQARRVLDALTPDANKELERFGVRFIANLAYPAQVFFCRQPVKDLSDLKGRRIRTRGPADNNLVSAMGAQPVSVAFNEVYSALERGVVECAITSTASGNAAKWYEVTTHMYTLPLAWALSGYGTNIAWWNKLDADVQRFLQATFNEISDKQWALAQELTQDGIDCNTGKPTCKLGTLVKERPMIEVRPTEADKTLLRKTLADNVIPAWVKRCGERCGEIYNRVVAPIAGVRYEKR